MLNRRTKTMQNDINEIFNAIFNAIAMDCETQASTLEFNRLSIAAQAGDRSLFQALLEAEHYHQRRKDEPTLLIGAVMAGRLEVVRALIEAGADVNAKMTQFFTFDALSFAVDEGYSAIVKLLLDAGADPNWNNHNPALCPIRVACQKGYTSIVQILLQAGAVVKFGTGFRLLVDAAQYSNAEIVQLLIDSGCNVNTREVGGDTPLIAACKRAKLEIVNVLINAGANVNKAGMYNSTPIVGVFIAPKLRSVLEPREPMASKAIEQSITSIVKALLDAGADPNVKDMLGKTPLMLAIEQQNLDAVSILINANANVNAIMQPDFDSIFVRDLNIVRQTALHLAIATENFVIIKRLLDAGADPNLANSDGVTALEFAKQKGLKC